MGKLRWWMILAFLIGMSSAAVAAEEDTAQMRDYKPEDTMERRFLKNFSLHSSDLGVYYVPPVDVQERGYIFDDIPRETIRTQAHLTEQRIRKQGSFVKFNHRQISYSLMETRDDSVRFHLYPTKKALMLAWSHAIPVLAD